MTGKSLTEQTSGTVFGADDRVTRLGGLPLQFRRRRDRYLWQKLVMLGIDGLSLAVALTISLVVAALWQHHAPVPVWTVGLANGIAVYLLFAGIAVCRFWLNGHYARRKTFWDELRETLQTVAVVAALHIAVASLGERTLAPLLILTAWLQALLYVPLVRMGLKWLLIRNGYWQKPTVIIGAGAKAREAYSALSSEPLLGFHVVAFLDPDAAASTTARFIEVRGLPVPVRPLGVEPARAIKSLGFPHVVLALDGTALSSDQSMLERLQMDHNDIMVVPPISGLPLLGMEVSHFFSHDVLFLQPRNNLARSSSRLLKRVFDVLAAGAGLLVLSPLLGWIAWQVKRDGGPAFYGHKRVGLRGRYFSCYKFRSMVLNSDKVLKQLLADDPVAREEWQRDFKLKNDPRITRIGAFLRRTSLDELPQLWNVLKGDMSLVGPRPVIEEELQRYGNKLRYYLFVRPGITGLWQISGRNDVDYSERISFDTWYTKNWCLWYDIAILLRTVKVVFEGRGAY
jgi:Undecaprenyl-phosphate galactose phosphotransferase WbaP